MIPAPRVAALALLFLAPLVSLAAEPAVKAEAKARAKPAQESTPNAAGAAAKYKLRPGASGQICLDCHGDFQLVVAKPFLHTPVKTRNCVACHSPHASDHGKLLAVEPAKVCYQCHAKIVPAAPKSTHRPVAEKGCTACHDAHASQNKFVLLKPEGELCASCHKPVVEAAAKARYPHRPLAQTGCTTCHDPHGSDKADHLLKAAPPDLCLACHKTSAPIFAKAHLNYPVGKADCTSCHDPHGSSQRGMLYDKVHPPVAKLMCAQCHEAATSPNPLATKAEAPGLCRSCHASMLTAMLDKNRVHQPVLEGKSCLTCHSPHASKEAALLRSSPAKVCGNCHADTIAKNDRALERHAPVDAGECGSCHDPHSASSSFLFVNDDRIALCATCHDWTAHSTHPIGAKAIDPRNKNLSLDCLSCHRAHGTEHKKLLPYATQTEMCVKCHEAYTR